MSRELKKHRGRRRGRQGAKKDPNMRRRMKLWKKEITFARAG